MRFEPFTTVFSAAAVCLFSGCFGTASPELQGTQRITLKEACDCAVEHNSSVRFAARLKRLEREGKEATTLTTLPDLENLPGTTPPARRAELWADALENALFFNYIPLSETVTEAEQKIRLREEELLKGRTAELYCLLAQDAEHLRKGNLSAEERVRLQKRLASQSFELAVHIGSTAHPMPGERFSKPLKGSLDELLKEAGRCRAAMPELCRSGAAVESALRLYRELKSTPGYTPGKIVRILFYLPSARLRSNEKPISQELNALTFLLGNAAELDLLLEAREKTGAAAPEQLLKIEALLRTARGFGSSLPVHVSEKAMRRAESQMRDLIRSL